MSILSMYDISKYVDDKGNVVEPLVEYEDGLVRCVRCGGLSGLILFCFLHFSHKSPEGF